jgi:TRAP-type mannitol/chloroaromatic compound transport system permease small subunit
MTIKIFQKAESIIERVAMWALLISGLMVVVMGFSSTYAVVCRYIFRSPEPYSYEISTIFLCVGTVLTFAGLQRHKRHLRVDFLTNYLPQKVQLFLLDILGPLIGMFFVGIICWKSWEGAIYSFGVNELSTSIWQEPVWPIRFIIPISMFWLILTLVCQLVHGIINITGGAKSPVKATETNPIKV